VSESWRPRESRRALGPVPVFRAVPLARAPFDLIRSEAMAPTRASRAEFGGNRNGSEIEYKICRKRTKPGCSRSIGLRAESM